MGKDNTFWRYGQRIETFISNMPHLDTVTYEMLARIILFTIVIIMILKTERLGDIVQGIMIRETKIENTFSKLNLDADLDTKEVKKDRIWLAHHSKYFKLNQ